MTFQFESFMPLKQKILAGSYQTLLIISQSKVRILWANCTQLTIFALNELFFCTFTKKKNCTGVGQSETSNFVLYIINPFLPKGFSIDE